MFACGNVLHVHDLVDNVSAEAILAGKSAAAYALGAQDTAVSTRRVKPAGSVRYVVPQRLSAAAGGKVDLYFRVGGVVKPARLVVKCDGVELLSRKKQIMTPGEMEKVTVDIPAGGDIEICAEQA